MNTSVIIKLHFWEGGAVRKWILMFLYFRSLRILHGQGPVTSWNDLYFPISPTWWGSKIKLRYSKPFRFFFLAQYTAILQGFMLNMFPESISTARPHFLCKSWHLRTFFWRSFQMISHFNCISWNSCYWTSCAWQPVGASPQRRARRWTRRRTPATPLSW